MKKYVFLTFAVSGIGGTQIYVRNKLRYLHRHGWDVSMITTESGGNVVIDDLVPFAQSCMPELLDNPYLYAPGTRKKILQKAKALIGRWDSETVIETNFIQVTLWGELLAKEMGVRHFIFLIQEEYRNHGQEYLKYYSYKYDRGEFAVNTRYALGQLFAGFRDIADETCGFLSAECSNVVEDCENKYDAQIADADYHIGSIGRVNKPFVLKMVQDVASYAMHYPSKTFQLILFGGSPEMEDYDRIYGIIEKVQNISVLITGPIFPIPKRLVDKMDVFIASAGAAVSSHNAGCITIAIDANDLEPIGVLGHTTMEIIHRDKTQPIKSIQILLDEILMDGIYPKKHDCVILTEQDMDAVFERHMQHLAKAEETRIYYDVSKICPKALIRFGYRLLGKKNLIKLYRIVKKRNKSTM